MLQSKRIGYDGEVVAKAVDLTMAQVLPGCHHPLKALDIAEGQLKVLLANPPMSMMPMEEWPTSRS